jgi:hypothetical protein
MIVIYIRKTISFLITYCAAATKVTMLCSTSQQTSIRSENITSDNNNYVNLLPVTRIRTAFYNVPIKRALASRNSQPGALLVVVHACACKIAGRVMISRQLQRL